MPFRQTLGCLLSAGLLMQPAFPAQARAEGGVDSRGERGTPGCPRAQVGINGIGAELTRISALAACPRTPRKCQYGATYGPSRDLPGMWWGPTSYLFTVREQDGLIAKAQAAAASAAPQGLQLIGLTFSEELYGLAGPPKGLRVNARADYGRCSRTPYQVR